MYWITKRDPVQTQYHTRMFFSAAPAVPCAPKSVSSRHSQVLVSVYALAESTHHTQPLVLPAAPSIKSSGTLLQSCLATELSRYLLSSPRPSNCCLSWRSSPFWTGRVTPLPLSIGRHADPYGNTYTAPTQQHLVLTSTRSHPPLHLTQHHCRPPPEPLYLCFSLSVCHP